MGGRGPLLAPSGDCGVAVVPMVEEVTGGGRDQVFLASSVETAASFEVSFQ